MIVKPMDCNSSKGVRRVKNLEELHEDFADALYFSLTDTAIIKEYIEGSEITVDVYGKMAK